MIEVEKKFNLSKEQDQKLKKDLDFLSEKEITDSYYDNEGYDLTKNDIWLRERNGQFELKVCQDKNIDRKADQYGEITDEAGIRKYLKLKQQDSFINDLEKAGYSPFCSLKTIRSKFKSSPFIVDIDEVTSDGFFYGLAEVELMVNEKSEIEKTIEQIMDFAQKKGLNTGIYTRGKVVEYIRQKRPDHFKVLTENGIAK